MNCNCNPPKLAVVRKVSKSGENFGKEFFSCANSNCKLFHWVGAPIPLSLTNRSNNRAASAITEKTLPNGPVLKVILSKFDDSGSTPRIWFSLLGHYTKPLLSYFATLSNEMKLFDNKLKLWNFDFGIYDQVVSSVQASAIGINVVELPRFLVNGLRNYLRSLPKDMQLDPDLNLDSSLLDTLLPFQVDGIRFVVRHGGRAMIADEMGCGKTIQAIGVMQHYRSRWPVLLLVPPALMQQWVDELKNHMKSCLREKDIRCVKKATDPVQGKICIVPYTLLDRLVSTDKLVPEAFGIVIADESHYLKNKDSKRSNMAMPILKAAKIAVCMTGTPATNRPVELFAQLNALLPNVFTDYEQFTHRYCDSKPSQFGSGQDVRGSSHESELKLLLESMVMIRRLKCDVIDNLPTKLRELRHVDADPVYLGQLKDIQKKQSLLDRTLRDTTLDPSTVNQLRVERSALLMAYYELTGLCKVSAIKLEVKKLVEEIRSKLKSDKLLHASASICSSSTETCGTTDQDVIDLSDEAECNAHSDMAVTRVSTAQPCSRSVLMTLEEDDIFVSKDNCDDNNRVDGDITVFGTAIENQFESRAKLQHSEDSDLVDSEDEYDASDKQNSKLCKALRPPTNKSSTKLQKKSKTAEEDDDLFFSELNKPVKKSVKEYSDASDGEEEVPACHDRIKYPAKNNHDNIDYNNDDDDDGDDNEHAVGTCTAWRDILDGHAGDVPQKLLTSKPRKQSKTAQRCAMLDGQVSKESRHNINPPNVFHGLGKKIIIFAHHHSVLDALEDCLQEMGVGYVRVDGHCTANARNAYIKKFQEDDVTDIALLSVTACGTGLNLTRAHVALFAELYWSPGAVLQAEDRIHRLGQKSTTVRIIYIVARKTADDIIWEQIQKKHSVLGATVGIADSRSHGSMVIDRRQTDKCDTAQSTLDTFMFNSAVEPSSEINVTAVASECMINNTAGQTNTSSALNSKPVHHNPYIKRIQEARDSAAAVIDIDRTSQQPSDENFQYSCNSDSQSIVGESHTVLTNGSSSSVQPSHIQHGIQQQSGACVVLPQPPQINPYQIQQPPYHQPQYQQHQQQQQLVPPVTATVAGSSHKRALSPNTLARIESNRQVALQRRAMNKTVNCPALGLASPQPESLALKSPEARNYDDQIDKCVTNTGTGTCASMTMTMPVTMSMGMTMSTARGRLVPVSDSQLWAAAVMLDMPTRNSISGVNHSSKEHHARSVD